MEIRYRTFEEKDSEQVKSVALQAWKHTYNGIFPVSFIEDFVEQNYSAAGLKALAADVRPGRMFFVVAIDEGRQSGSESSNKIIGFCNIGYRGVGWELFRIYLLPQYIGKGIGTAMLKQGEGFIRSKGADVYFCFVHRKNSQGINFYVKSGFTHVPELDKQDEWCMVKEL